MDYEMVSDPLADAPPLDRALRFAWDAISPFGVSMPDQSDVFIFFKALGGLLGTPSEERVSATAGDLMVHVAYLAEKAGRQSTDLLRGDVFDAERQVILEALCNIGAILQAAVEMPPKGPLADTPASIHEIVGCECFTAEPTAVADCRGDVSTIPETASANPGEGPSARIQADVLAPIVEVVLTGDSFSAEQQRILDELGAMGIVLRGALEKRLKQPPPGIPEDVFNLILEGEAKLAGWCSREKALMIARTVLQARPKTCVEIGVFGGRSLVPCAAALRHIGAGEIYGIEAWRSDVAIENATNAVNDDWWSKVDFARIKQEFYRFVAATDLTRHVRVIEAPSARAAALFDAIDFLHIDGAHSVVNAAEDVILYARKVRSGGIVVFDDVNWQSTAPALELLGALCDTVTVLKDSDSGLDICAVMRRR